MKHTFARMGRRSLAMLLALCMMLGMVGTAFAAEPEETLNYVSIGDSMANGYCFDGYEQGNGSKINFFEGKGVYGADAYPLQFEEWLEGQGYDVDHTKLAVSALRAEDLYFLLGGREEAIDGWQNQVNGYTEVDDDAALAAFYQAAVADADLITLGVGNASFGAYLLHKVTNALGLFGASLDEEEKVDLEDALIDLDEEQKKVVLDAYNELKAELYAYIPAELAAQYNVDQICGLLAYTAAGYLLNYKGSLEQIVALNDDVEVILVGLMNTTYGMEITMDGMDPIPVGDIMDKFFGALNAYAAALPTVMQASGEWENAKFYYAEQPNPLFISQQFAELKAANWGVVDRLSGAIVRDRNIQAYNGTLRPMIAQLIGMTLPEISINDLTVPQDQMHYVSAQIYLGIEDAVAASCDTMEIPLSGLIKIATDLPSAFAGMEFPTDPTQIRNTLAAHLTSSEELMGMCKIYALFKVGNGMSVHPTPAGHDEIAKAVIEAYETNHTAAEETGENLLAAAEALAALVAEYYDEAYAYAYAEAKNAGAIDAAAAAIDEAIAALTTIDVTAIDATDAFKAELAEEVKEIVETLAAAKALLIEADVLDEASLNALTAMLDEADEAIANVLDLLAQAGVDVNDLVIVPALETAKEQLAVAIETAKVQLAAAVEAGTQWLLTKAQEGYDALVEAIVEALPAVDQFLYDWLYNNPEKVIAFFNEYGDEIGAVLDECKEEIAAVLGYIVVNYGEDVACYVLDNAEEILAAMIEWYEAHGEETWAMIDVYLEALGVYDAIEDCTDAIEAKLEELLAKVDADVAAAVKLAVAELQAVVEDVLAEVEAVKNEIKGQIEDLKAELEALEQELADKKAQLENAAADVKAQIEAEIAKIEAAIAEAKAAIAALEQQLAVIAEKAEALYEAILGIDDAIKTMIEEGLNAGLVALQTAMDDVAEALVDLAAAIAEDLAAMAAEAVEDVKAMLNKAYIDNTTDNYIVTEDSYYVALGDADAYGKSADLLTQALGLCASHANLTESGLTADALLANIDAYAAEIAKADLITMGFSANTFTTFAAAQVKAALYGKAPAEMDWVQFIGEDGAAKIAAELAAMEADFVAEGVPAQYAAIMTLAIESYAYAYVSHMADYALAAEAVHAINPEALLVLVGMYNPMNGVILDLGETQIDMGEYVRYLVDAANGYSLAYAMLISETIYVDAPAVETASTGTVVNVINFIADLVYNPTALDAYAPTDAGYVYIEEQILKALNPSFVASGLLGDVNNDGLVDVEDAMLILQYEAEIIDASALNLCVGDVNADGFVDVEDAMFILKLDAEIIEKLPAA